MEIDIKVEDDKLTIVRITCRSVEDIDKAASIRYHIDQIVKTLKDEKED